MMLTTVSTTEDTEFTEKNPFSTKRLAKDLHLCVLCALYGKTLLQQQMRPGKKNTRRGGRVLGEEQGLWITAAWA